MGNIMSGRGGGGSGATLVVTGVAGDTCIITKDGKSKTKTFNSTGTATFKGLETGTWTVTMTAGTGQSATQTIVINADYTLTISYFSATIAVTYPAGSTCTCTNGSTVLTAPDTGGSYTFTVPSTGTWTVSCTDGTKTASKTVSITTDGQTASVTLIYQLVLYNAGDKNLDVTGGYEDIGTSNVNFPITETDNSVKFSSPRGDFHRWRSKNIIDFSQISTITANWTGRYFQMQIVDNAGSTLAYSRSEVLDCSNISSGYFEFGCNHYNVSEGASERNCTVTSIIGV